MCPRMDAWITKMWCVLSGLLFSHEQEGNPAFCDNMGETWGHCAKRTKSNTIQFHLYVNSEKSTWKKDLGNREQIGGCQGAVVGMSVKRNRPWYISWLSSEIQRVACWLNSPVLSRSLMSDSCSLMDCSLPGSSVHGVLQARTLERVAMPFCRGSSLDRTHLSHVSSIAGGFCL